MKVPIKIIVLAVLAVVMLVSPLIADGVKGKTENVQISLTEDGPTEAVRDGEFYFPDYDSTLTEFWGEEGLMHNTCSATGWLGGRASATCLERQNCVCTTTFLTAECHCENVRGTSNKLSKN